MLFTLLVVVTVSASSHPLEAADATTLPTLEQHKISGVNGSGSTFSPAPNKPLGSENRLEITLKIDESDKEIVDSDMGKYHDKARTTNLLC